MGSFGLSFDFVPPLLTDGLTRSTKQAISSYLYIFSPENKHTKLVYLVPRESDQPWRVLVKPDLFQPLIDGDVSSVPLQGSCSKIRCPTASLSPGAGWRNSWSQREVLRSRDRDCGHAWWECNKYSISCRQLCLPLPPLPPKKPFNVQWMPFNVQWMSNSLTDDVTGVSITHVHWIF